MSEGELSLLTACLLIVLIITFFIVNTWTQKLIEAFKEVKTKDEAEKKVNNDKNNHKENTSL